MQITPVIENDISVASHKSASSFDMSTNVMDPMRAFTKIKEEFLYIFSGFNDSKLFSCECYDV
jgi:hypothetical protein